MHRSSLRTWLLVVSIVFSVIVVGGISLTTYVILADGMQAIAYDVTERLAATASAVVREATAAAESAAASQDSSTTPKAIIADSELARQLPLAPEPRDHRRR